MKAILTILNVTLELDAKSEKELWQKIAFYQSLPTTCPIDDTPTRFAFRSPKGNDYYEIANTNPNYYITMHVGQSKEGGELYADGTWSWWDWKNKVDVTLAKWSTLTDEGQQLRDYILGGDERDNQPPIAPTKQQPSVTTPKADPPITTARHIFHALGMALSAEVTPAGEDPSAVWETQRTTMVRNIGMRRTPKVKLESSNDLTLDEINAAIEIMEKRAREAITQWAGILDFDDDMLAEFIPEKSLDKTFGVPLANALKEIRKHADRNEIPY